MGNQYIMQLRIQLSSAKKEFKEHKIKINNSTFEQ